MGPAIVTTTTLLGLLLILVSTIYIFLQRLKTYWERRNVPTIAENAFHGIFRDMMELKETINASYRKAYETHKDLKYYGTFFFGRPTLVVQDLDIVKHILVKDFNNFNGHGLFCDMDMDPLSGHLFGLTGQKWRSMRTKLSATFTAGKMKYMFDKMQESIDRLPGAIERELEAKQEVFNMKEKLACLGTDIIASVAFGIEVNCLDNPQSEFREMGKLVFAPTLKEFARNMARLNAHWITRLFRIKTTNARTYKFFMELVSNTVNFREKNDVVRKDFLNLLLQLKNKGYIDVDGKETPADKEANLDALSYITFNELAAQVFVFYVAGFESTSSLTSFILYELSIHKDIQQKVQEECDKVLRENGGKISYDAVQSMEYCDKVIHETLRFYPPLGGLTRSTIADCKLPLTDIQLDNNTLIAIPIQGFHMDPQYFPDPEKFDPERFSEDEKANRPPHVYMPFGDGPRICIGIRFALVQIKSLLLVLFSRYNFDLSDDTPVPIQLDPKAMITTPAKLDFKISKRYR